MLFKVQINLTGIPKLKTRRLIWRRGDQRYRAKFTGLLLRSCCEGTRTHSCWPQTFIGVWQWHGIDCDNIDSEPLCVQFYYLLACLSTARYIVYCSITTSTTIRRTTSRFSTPELAPGPCPPGTVTLPGLLRECQLLPGSPQWILATVPWSGIYIGGHTVPI